ncbi:helix-turn-helix domain-containing protein [Sphaerisporangium corydalis]|uniref:Helix-turn-helix domain-containing protein n=1 Tax=Sphaerisporangium corydalis TaxID=1441875 RepID=A0ABV9EM12_9ACTN|nr:helix-turn-helix transcriptional regulator [Sphaerisporangium corydalis]
MADGHRSPTVRLRRLGHELRRMREATGKTIYEAAADLEWSSAKISRLENGLTKRPDVHHVRALCALYDITETAVVEAMVTLAREARKRGWWSAYKDVLAGSYVGLEAEASSIRTFQPLVIPGLLQTAEYTAAICRAAMVRDDAEVERRVEARLARQQILVRDDPPHLWAVIDEAALLRLGPEVREGQLRKLLDTSPLEHVKVQVLPMSAGLHAGLAGPFVILEFPDPTDRSIVYLETATDDLYLEESAQVGRYTLLFQHVCASALSIDASIAHLSTMLDELEGDDGTVPRQVAEKLPQPRQWR